jgi:hypothetical protein
MAIAYTFPLGVTGAYASVSQIAPTEQIIYNEILLSAAPVLNDVVTMMTAPRGSRCVGITLSSTDLDDGTALVLAVGDAVDDDRFVTGSTIGQAGGVTTAIALAGFGYKFAADTAIILKCTTAPGTPVAVGTIRLAMRLVFDTRS